ncbi:type IV toxin-antitoxin system AbiEi family antitoxin domain-containing protein [Planctomycetota bacterium]
MDRRDVRAEALNRFRSHGGILRTSLALKLGIHPRTLYQLRDEGTLVRVSRGLHRLAEFPPFTEPDLAPVAARVPDAVICLISALVFHEMTTEIAHEVQIALPRGKNPPSLDFPPVRVFHFSGGALTEGIQEHRLDGVTVRIYGPEKTVADCFKFRNKIGLEAAIGALKLALRKGLRPAEILRYSRMCRVQRIILPYLEALI